MAALSSLNYPFAAMRKSDAAAQGAGPSIQQIEKAPQSDTPDIFAQISNLQEVPQDIKVDLNKLANLLVESSNNSITGALKLSSDLENKLRDKYGARLSKEMLHQITNIFTESERKLTQPDYAEFGGWINFAVASPRVDTSNIEFETSGIYFNIVTHVLSQAKQAITQVVLHQSDKVATNLYNVDQGKFEAEHLRLSRSYQDILDTFKQINIALTSAFILFRTSGVQDILELESSLITDSTNDPVVAVEMLEKNCKKILEMLEGHLIDRGAGILIGYNQEIEGLIKKARTIAENINDAKLLQEPVLTSRLESFNLQKTAKALKQLADSARLETDDPRISDRGLIVLDHTEEEFLDMLRSGSVVITLRDQLDNIVGATICTPPEVFEKRDPVTFEKLKKFGRVGEMGLMIVDPELGGSEAYTILQRAAVIYMQSQDVDIMSAVIARDNQRSLTAAIREDWRIFPQNLLLDSVENNSTTRVETLTTSANVKKAMPFIGVIRPVAINLRQQSALSMSNSSEFRDTLARQIYNQMLPGIFDLGWVNSMEAYDKNAARVKYLTALIQEQKTQLQDTKKSEIEKLKIQSTIEKLSEESNLRSTRNANMLQSLRYEANHWPEYLYLDMDVIPAVLEGARWVRENDVFLYSDPEKRKALKAKYNEL